MEFILHVLSRIIKSYIEVIVFWIDWRSAVYFNPGWYFYQYELVTVSQIRRKPYIATMKLLI